MNDPIARLRAAADAHRPAWDGDLDVLIRRSRVRRTKALTAGATAMTALAALLVLPGGDAPHRLGVTTDRTGVSPAPDRPDDTAAPSPDPTPAPDAPATTGTGPVAATPHPGLPTVPGVPGLPSPLPGLPTGDPTTDPTGDPTGPPPTHRPSQTARPPEQPSPDPSPGPRNWWDHYDSPQPDPAPYRDATFGPAPYFERRYVAGDADTYCTHPPSDPVLPRPGEEQPVCANLWYGIAKDRTTWVVTTSLCIADGKSAATYQFAEGQEMDLFLWAEDIGYAEEQALYTWSKHRTPEPAHSVTIEPGDCVQYVWNLPLGDDAGKRLDKGRRYQVGGRMRGATADEGRWGWYGEEFYG